MFCRLDELGLEAGQCLEPDRAVLACRVLEPDQWCGDCGCEGTPPDTVVRQLAHEPLGCAGPRRGRSSRAAGFGGRWEAIVVQHLTVARVDEGLGVAWNIANDAVLAEGRRVLIDSENRFDGVRVLGVDEHVC